MNLSSWRWYFYPRQYCSCWEGVRRGKHDCTGRLLSWVNPGTALLPSSNGAYALIVPFFLIYVLVKFITCT